MRLATLVLAFAAVAATRASAIGILVPTDPGGQPLTLVSHRVDVKIVERGATTHVTQEFENPTGRPLEATYLFPLPRGATVDEFALWMNGSRQTGKVLEKNQARQIYQGIVARARDPGLIEYVDSQLFEARVFPVPATGRLKVELTFSSLVDYDNGLHRYVYPMKTDQRAASTLQDFTFSVSIDSKLEIKNLYSPTHKMATRRSGRHAVASLERDGFSLADDLALYWSVDDKDVGVTVLSYKDGDGAGYFMMLASPKDGLRESEIIGKRVAFVVDTSGSMDGEKIEATRRALVQCLSRLGEDDLFSIVSFGGYAEPWKQKMVAASRSNVAAAKAWVNKLEAMGGTNIDEALQTAFATATGSDKTPLMMVFMTDGRPTIGETDTAKIVARAQRERQEKKARIFVLGVGDDLNPQLLDKLSSANGGSALYLKGTAALEGEVSSFYERISHPVLADLHLDVDGDVNVFGTQPRVLGDLFAGEQLVVLGRYRNPGDARFKLTGTTPHGKRTFTATAQLAERATEHTFIPRLWAQRQVGMLLDEIRDKGEKPGLVAEVTQLATRFGIVTPYTSYLVVEPTSPVAEPDLRLERERRIDDLMGPPPPPADMPASAAPVPATGADEADKDGAGFFHGLFGGGSAATSGGAKGAPRGRPMALEEARKAMRAESGEGAVAAAKEIGKLKKADTLSRTRVATSTKRALGRDFTMRDGFFVDGACGAKDKVLAVKAYSDAFFQVLERRPDLKAALALGDHVKVSVGKGKTLVIGPSGVDKRDDPRLARFL